MVSTFLKIAKELVNMSKPNIVFVLGAPGAGKGTQCQKIVNHLGYVHLSAGDLLREERDNPGSQYGELIENYIREGKIVPVEITCSLLRNAMIKSGKDKFLIDGFPRNYDNLTGWKKEMEDKVKLLFVLFFECPKEASIERCLGRGAAGSGRTDDNLQSLEKRFNTYLNETQPVIQYYEQLGLVKTVPATKSPDEVFEEVKGVFQTLDDGGDH